jgi:hypothetical protein
VLRSQITLRDGVVQQSNFDGYEPTHMNSIDQPSGKPGLPPIAPAAGNAVAAAPGKRLHSLPLGLTTLASWPSRCVSKFSRLFNHIFSGDKKALRDGDTERHWLS